MYGYISINIVQKFNNRSKQSADRLHSKQPFSRLINKSSRFFFSSKWIAKLTWLAFLEKHNNLLICRVARDERENSRKLHKTERGTYDIFDYLFWLRILINCQVDRDQHMTHECSWRKHTTRKWRLWRFWLSLVVENKDKFLFCIRVYLVFVEAYLLRHVPIN